jgi:AraC-like DNA-binding protein
MRSARREVERTVVACYRELAPSAVLRGRVRAFFSFVPAEAPVSPGRRITRQVLFEEGDSFCSPVLADGTASVVFDIGMRGGADGRWRDSASAPRGDIIGAMNRVGATDVAERAAMLGVYFEPGQGTSFLHLPASELADRVVPLDAVWGPFASDLAEQLAELDEAGRVQHLEAHLTRQLGERPPMPTSVDVPGLASWVVASRGRIGVAALADAAGVSRQHLTRAFRDVVGVSPKVFCRLARFQAGLAHAGRGEREEWARAATDLGYADQSHMIAEFREFSSLTPHQLATGRWFHPFIERARAARRAHSH